MAEDFNVYIKSPISISAKVSLYEHLTSNSMEAEVRFKSPYDEKEHLERIVFGMCGISKAKKKITGRLYQILEFQKLKIENKRWNKVMGNLSSRSRKRERRKSRRY